MSECKYCGTEHANGSNFCTRKCRIAHIRKHEKRGAKKRHANRILPGAAFDYLGNDPEGY